MQIDIQALSEQLGCPVIPMVSTKASGIDKLKDTIDSFPATKRKPEELLTSYPTWLLNEVESLAEKINHDEFNLQQRRWMALQCLEGGYLYSSTC